MQRNRPPVQAYASDEYDEARASRHKKKSPAPTGEINTESSNHQEGDPMNTRLSQFSASFEIATKHADISVDAAHNDESSVVCLEVDGAHAPMTPAEALSIAAALQAVAVHLMESETREIRRMTEPGAPAFEETI